MPALASNPTFVYTRGETSQIVKELALVATANIVTTRAYRGDQNVDSYVIDHAGAIGDGRESIKLVVMHVSSNVHKTK